MRGEKIIIICHCGNIRIDYKSNNKRKGSGQFCSTKCHDLIRKGKNFSGIRDNFKSGKDHPFWKGDEAKYSAIHMWVRFYLGKPIKCVNNDCSKKSKHFVWANISGKYKRDLNDWRELCNSCNMKDGIKIAPRFLEKKSKEVLSYNY